MSANNIPAGLKVPTQTPLDAKLHVASQAVLSNLGTNNNLAYTYYEGMVVYCVAERTRWEWREVGGTGTKLLITDFTYPNNLVVDGVTYSNKVFNFYQTSLAGPTGPAGPTGTTGAQGIPGTPGTNGAAGTDGVFGGNSVQSMGWALTSNAIEGNSFITQPVAYHIFRASNVADYTTIYQVGFNNVNIVGGDLSSWIDTFTLSNSATKGYLRFFNATNSQEFLILAIKNVIVQGTGPNTLTSFAVEYITHNGIFPWNTNGNGVCSFTQNGSSSDNLQRTISTFSDSSYELQPEDNNYTLIIDTQGTNKFIGIPSTGLPEKFAVALIQKGAGDVTITPYSGVTMSTPIAFANKIKGPSFFAFLEKEGTSNTYYLGGNII